MVGGTYSLRVLLADRPEGRGRREHGLDAVVGRHAPELPRVRCADRLALVQDGRGAGQQGPVDDVRMTDDPADVGSGEHRLAGADVVHGAHRPVQGDRVTAAVTDHSLGLPGRPGGVEDVQGIVRRHGDARGRRCRGHQVGPVEVVGAQLGTSLRTLQDHALLGLVGGEFDGPVEQRLVRDDPLALDSAGGGDDHLGRGVVDAERQLARGEPAEDDRVDGADPGAGQHRDGRLGNHRQVDHDPVAASHAELGERPGEGRHLVPQPRVAVRAPGACDGGVVDERGLVAAAGFDVPVERVEADVEPSVGKPAVKGGVRGVQGPSRGDVPVDAFGGAEPEGLGVVHAGAEDILVHSHRGLLLSRRGSNAVASGCG